MLDMVIEYVALLLAAIIVMIVHEFFKYMIFLIAEPKRRKHDFKNLFKLHKYVDLVGLIFFITTWVGFSKTSKYRVSKTRTLICIGFTGFISLLLLFSLSAYLSVEVLTESIVPVAESANYVAMSLLVKMNSLVCIFSLSMLLVNLYPMATFDISYIIAARSQKNYIGILKYDVILKVIFTLLVLGGWVTLGVDYIMQYLKL